MVWFPGIQLGAPAPPPCTCIAGDVKKCALHAPKPVAPPQSVADDIALAAQYYAGSLVGHPYRSTQYGTDFAVRVDKLRKWKPRAIVKDNCLFCQQTTNEDVLRRIEGYQAQIDIEVMRSKTSYYIIW